jgi:hypothetical protein
VHDYRAVEVTWRSFEKETLMPSGHMPYNISSGAGGIHRRYVAKSGADLESCSFCHSAFGHAREGDRQFDAAYHTKHIADPRNKWLCYDFRERRIVRTDGGIRTNSNGPGEAHLKSWLVETSADGESWREVAREAENEQFNGKSFTGTFAVLGGEPYRFIRIANIGRNYFGNDSLAISAWEVFR